MSTPFHGRIIFMTGRLEIKTPPLFNFWRTVYSHGWCSLPPFFVDKEHESLSRLVELGDGTLIQCVMRPKPGGITVALHCQTSLAAGQKNETRNLLCVCLRLKDNLSEFYREAARDSKYRWIPKAGAGRLLRAPTVFEDVVKMICTTNCSWSLTEVMVRNLTTVIGKSLGDGLSAFPSPQAIAGTTEAFLRKHIRTGYRSPYLLELATVVAEERLDLESWRSSPLSTEELFKEVKSVKGMGDYAAGNILKLLGRYDYLGLDSWVRAKFYELHTRGRKVKDSTIEKRYAPLGKWRGLFFWLEMTREWYNHKFPF
jgi:N-glycosylase/DNA lyase